MEFRRVLFRSDPAPPPASYIAVSGGLFKDMAIHDFDMARWLLGEEPATVYPAGSCLVDPEIGALGHIDTARPVLTPASGRLGVLSHSRRTGLRPHQHGRTQCRARMGST